MNLTPLDIEKQQFKVCLRGYDTHEVEQFLAEVADALHAQQNDNKTLQKKLRRLKQEIQAETKRKEAFQHALHNSRKVLDQMKENARKSAAVIIADAEVKAERVLRRAHHRQSRLQQEIATLKRQRMQLEAQIHSVIEAHAKLLKLRKDSMHVTGKKTAVHKRPALKS